MNFQTATICKQGGRQYNEDWLGYISQDNDSNCWVLADGLGGHGGGDIASRLAVDVILSSFQENSTFSSENIKDLFQKSYEAIKDGQSSSPQLKHMQTTAVCLITQGNEALWGHVGDSRLYHFHEHLIQKQTFDHSVPQMLAKAGEIESSEIRFHEDRNRLLRSIGSKDGVKPHIELSAITLVPGDAFLLCTDGFWEHVFENEMELDSVQTTGAEDWISVMEERLLNRVLPGNDNYSAIAIIVF